MDQVLDTVRVKLGTDDYMVINQSDFDPAIHELFGVEKPTAEEPPLIVRLLEKPAADVIPAVADIKDVFMLATLEEAETAGKKRKTVLEAIAARLAELANGEPPIPTDPE